MGKLNRPFALAGKEVKIYLRDVQALFFSLALPLVLIVLMVAAFGGQMQFHTTAYVVNLDQGSSGAELIQRLRSVPELTVEVLDQESAERRLGDSNIISYILIGPDFSAGVTDGNVELTVRQRGAGGTEGQIVASYAAAKAREIAGEAAVAVRVEDSLATMGLSVDTEAVGAEVTSLFAEVRANPTVKVTEETVGARPEPVAMYLPGLVTMFTAFAISLMAVTIVEERKKGTLERLMTTRMSRVEFLTGTWLGAFFRGLIQVVFFFVLAALVFRIFDLLAFLNLLVLGVVAVASVSGFGLVIASVTKTPETANWVAVFVTMIMTILGGSFFDVTGIKGVVGVLSRLTYNFWANDAFRRVISRSEGLASPAVLKDVAVLLAIGVLAWAIALAAFRVRGDER